MDNVMNLSDEKLLAKGATGIIYLAKLDGREVVAKKAIHPQDSRLEREYNILNALDGDFTPKAYGLINEPDRLILVEEFIKGTHLGWESAADLAVILAPQLADFHKKCENLDIAGVPRSSIYKFMDNTIHTLFNRFNSRFPDSLKERIGSLIERISAEVEKKSQAFKDVTLTLVHTDLIPLNIITEESGKVKVIDWEGARFDCAEWDVACFLKGFNADESVRKLFFDNYSYEIDADRLRLCEALHYLQVVVWRTDSNSGFDATDDLLSVIDSEIKGVERFL